MPNLIKVGMADYKVGAAPATLISYGLAAGQQAGTPLRHTGKVH